MVAIAKDSGLGDYDYARKSHLFICNSQIVRVWKERRPAHSGDRKAQQISKNRLAVGGGQ